MFESVNIGLMRECGSKKYMEWTIHNYFSIPQTMNHCIESPSFSFCNEMWYLVIYPYGQHITDSAGWVGIYLKKQYPTSLKQNVSFKIGLKRLGGTKYKSYKGAIISEGTLCCGTPKLCQQSDLKNEKSTVAPYDVLTVFCTLQVDNDLFIQKTSSITEKNMVGIDRSVKFDPPTCTDTIMKDGVWTSIDAKLQCITVMEEFENKSLEELRLEDYSSALEKTESFGLKLPKYGSSGFPCDATTLNFFKSNNIAENKKFSQPADFNTITKTQNILPSFTFGSSSQENSTMGIGKVRTTCGFNFSSSIPVTYSFASFGETNLTTISKTKDTHPSFTVGSSLQDNSNIDKIQTTYAFSSPCSVPVTCSSTSIKETYNNDVSEDNGVSFTFGSSMQESGSRNDEAMHKNDACKTEDNVTSLTSGSSTEENSTLGISQNQSTSGFSFGNISLQSSSRNIAPMNEDKFVQKTENDFEMTDYDREKDISEGLSKLSEDLKELYVKGKDTNMVLKVQDTEFKVHRNILMTRSPVFATMFGHDMVEKIDGLVQITDCDSGIFQEFLLYLYTGKVEKFSDKIIGLYQVADKYDIQLLKSQCAKFMMQNLCVDNFCEILTLAVQFKESDILKNATNFFVKNIKKIVITVNWLKFQKENPVEANELHIKALNYILPS